MNAHDLLVIGADSQFSPDQATVYRSIRAKIQCFKPCRKTFGHGYSFPVSEQQINDPAPYMMEGGILAIRDLVLGDPAVAQPQIAAQEDYYSASLKMLVGLAAR